MSILDKWFNSPESESDDQRRLREFKKSQTTPEEMAKSVTAFMAGTTSLRINSEMVPLVLERARLNKEEIDDIVTATLNLPLDNGLSPSANMAYLDGLRKRILKATEDMDAADVE